MADEKRTGRKATPEEAELVRLKAELKAAGEDLLELARAAVKLKKEGATDLELRGKRTIVGDFDSAFDAASDAGLVGHAPSSRRDALDEADAQAIAGGRDVPLFRGERSGRRRARVRRIRKAAKLGTTSRPRARRPKKTPAP